jgi:hypothetical protein
VAALLRSRRGRKDDFFNDCSSQNDSAGGRLAGFYLGERFARDHAAPKRAFRISPHTSHDVTEELA